MAAEMPADVVLIEQSHGINVVRFQRRTMLDPMAIATVGERLLALVKESGQRDILLDFSRVESLPSAMMGNFVALHQAVEAAGGRLVFCAVDPFLLRIFEICRMPGDIVIYPDEASALQMLKQDAS